jgi:hypothetical protein
MRVRAGVTVPPPQMPQMMMSRSAPRLLAAVLCAAVLVSGGCADRNPMALPDPLSPPPVSAGSLVCTADVGSGSLTCTAPPSAGAGYSAVILGGQGTYVRLASSGTHYDAPSATLRSDVTVENLSTQALGTADGVTPSPEGMRVFFAAPPTVTSGSGMVTVANADGTGTFTATGQAYFQYDGILSQGVTTAPKEWRFAVSGNVATFQFTVFISAPVRRETGWLQVRPLAPSLAVGDTQHLAAVARTVTGRAVDGGPIQWSTSDAAVATVDSAGVVTGVGPGTATVTATAGGRTGSAAVLVFTPSAGLPPPTVVWAGVESPTTRATGADTIWMEVEARGPGAAGALVWFSLQGPAGTPFITCTSATSPAGVARCGWVLPAGARSGVRRFAVQVISGGSRAVYNDMLLAAGAPALVNVLSPTEDTTAPVLTGFALSPDSVIAGGSINIAVTASDAGVGIARVDTHLRNPSTGQVYYCPATPPAGTLQSGTLSCQRSISPWAASGTWVIDSVFVSDANGLTLALGTSELQAAGFPTTFVVVEVDPDVTPPSLTALTLSRDTVTANGVDSITVTVSASDAKSGVSLLGVEFRKVGGTQTRYCSAPPFSSSPTLTTSCSFRFAAADAGSWRVSQVLLQDVALNGSTLSSAEVEAAGYQTEFTVTP